jgi:hypothetical protein
VLVFGSTAVLEEAYLLDTIRRSFPNAQLLGCSTAGEIYGTQVTDDSLVITAIHFQHTQLMGARININQVGSSFQAGVRLAQSLERHGLVHVFVLSDGLKINGSELVDGLTSQLPGDVTVTGGLSADGERFAQTLVVWDGAPESDTVVVLGFYGDRLRVG